MFHKQKNMKRILSLIVFKISIGTILFPLTETVTML